MRDHRYEFPRFHRVLSQAELLDRVMERLAADRLAAVRRDGGTAWQVARLRCVDCVHDRQCRAWLDAPVSKTGGRPPDFCINHAFLQAVVTDNAGRRCKEGE